MTIIREAIKKRMAELNVTTNQLSVELQGEIPRQTIYDFLSGKTDARTEVVAALMRVLDLEIVAKNRKDRKAGGK